MHLRITIVTGLLVANVLSANGAPPQERGRTIGKYIATPVTSLMTEALPLSGRYYVLTATSDSIDLSPEYLVAQFMRNGIPVIHLWHRPAKEDCPQAGWLYSHRKNFPAVFVVHIIDRHEGLRDLGFKEVAGRPHILCPYDGVKYTWQQ